MIRYTLHAREKMVERGILEEEVAETVEAGERTGRRGHRQVRRRVFSSGYEREGRRFPHKEVTVVYVEEGGETIILTCIARYGVWEVAS